MRIPAWGLVLLLSTLGLPGCARQLTRIETAVNDLVRDQRVLEQRQERLAKDVAQIRSALDATGELDREGTAALHARLDALERSVRQAEAGREEQEELLRRILAMLEMRGPRAPAAGTGASPTEDEAGGAPISSGSDVFDAAFADYTQGNFSLARDGFQELLDRFPQSALADDAAYWVGETWYSQGNFEEARAAFDRVLSRYPTGDKLAPAMLKLGYAYLELGQQERAVDAFRRLRNDHPDSDEALIAQHKLDSMAQEP